MNSTTTTCLRCEERTARGENGIGYDPNLCEECNIALQLNGEFGIEDDDYTCVKCGKPRDSGKESTLCHECREETRKHFGWHPVNNPWCAKCHKHQRRPGVDSVLCEHCARKSLALKLQIRQAMKSGNEKERDKSIYAFVPVAVDKRGQAKMF